MSGLKVFGAGHGVNHGVGGNNYTPGHWRADKPGGTVALPEGPQHPRPAPPERKSRLAETTAANIAAREAALAPRRYRPSEN